MNDNSIKGHRWVVVRGAKADSAITHIKHTTKEIHRTLAKQKDCSDRPPTLPEGVMTERPLGNLESTYYVIWKLGFRRAFGGTVNGNRPTENSNLPCTCFIFPWKSKQCVHQVQVAMYNSVFFNNYELL